MELTAEDGGESFRECAEFLTTSRITTRCTICKAFLNTLISQSIHNVFPFLHTGNALGESLTLACGMAGLNFVDIVP